jgi:hypothetical protein
MTHLFDKEAKSSSKVRKPGKEKRWALAACPSIQAATQGFLPRSLVGAFYQEDRTSFGAPHINWNDDKSFYLYALDAVGNTA